jgi:hypothetical protein
MISGAILVGIIHQSDITNEKDFAKVAWHSQMTSTEHETGTYGGRREHHEQDLQHMRR